MAIVARDGGDFAMVVFVVVVLVVVVVVVGVFHFRE